MIPDAFWYAVRREKFVILFFRCRECLRPAGSNFIWLFGVLVSPRGVEVVTLCPSDEPIQTIPLFDAAQDEAGYRLTFGGAGESGMKGLVELRKD